MMVKRIWRKTGIGLILTMLLTGVLVSAIKIQPAKAWIGGTIYIRADGSIDPPDAPITTYDNIIYTLTDNITSSADGIVVEKDNIWIDGKGYTLQGSGGPYRGIILTLRTGVDIVNMNIQNFSDGIYLNCSSNIYVIGNNIINNKVNLPSDFRKFWGGVHLCYCQDIAIFENNITNNSLAGIYLNCSDNNYIERNDIADNSYFGILTEGSSYNTIRENNLRNNTIGIELLGYILGGVFGSNSNEINNNNITDSKECGIFLDHLSLDNWIEGNVFWGDGLHAWDPYNNVIMWNVVNGKPLVCLREESNVTVSDAGEVILAKCKNITIKNLNLSYASVGIHLWETENTNISGNIITNNGEWGIILSGSKNNIISRNIIADNARGIASGSSENNVISENNITNNGRGCHFAYSVNNTVTGNSIAANNEAGISVNGISYINVCGNNIANNKYGIELWSSNNTISGNRIANNEYGIFVVFCSDNRIYHNNFISNTQQVHIEYNCTNIWDNGYPSGGNYWSDYAGIDEKSGPLQNQPGSDGIGDTPYIINVTGQNFDRYPLMHSYNYILTITTTTGGTTNPKPGTYTWQAGAPVSVTAIPNLNYIFDHWELDGINIGSQNPISLLMDTNHNLHAVFIPAYTITITAHCITECADVSVSIWLDGSPTGYTTPHTFTDLTGTHIITVPDTDPSGHPFKRWSTGSTNTTIIIAGGGTYTAYYGSYPAHAVAITSITPTKTVIGKKYSMNINVTILNPGDFTETLNVTVYANTTEIETKEITLENGASLTLTFTWDSTGFAKGNYTIWAYAWSVPGETDTVDNTCVDGTVLVGVPCDVTGLTPGVPDGVCNMRDIGYMCAHFMTTPSSPNWDPNCDVTGPTEGVPDDIVNMRDIGEACSHFNETDP